MSFSVYKECCKNCLFTKDRIVPKETADKVIEGCLKDDTYFICHKSSMEGGKTCCKTFFDKFKNDIAVLRVANRFDLIDFVPIDDNTKLTSYVEQQQNSLSRLGNVTKQPNNE